MHLENLASSPYINRFLQPDTIVPDLSNPQSWNRFSYVKNNPVIYIDPSGHNEIPWLVGLIVSAIVFAYDVGRRHGSDNYCNGTLSECFQSVELKKFTENQVVDTQEFHDMLTVIDGNLKEKLRTPYDPARADYDTPFYDGNGDDHTVCIENKCSPQSAVNYVAQGMYSAHTGQSSDDALALADRWNKWMHWHPATDDEKYWVEYGYNYYNSINNKEKRSSSNKGNNKPRIINKPNVEQLPI